MQTVNQLKKGHGFSRFQRQGGMPSAMLAFPKREDFLALATAILLSNYQALSKHVIQSFFSVSILLSAEMKIYRRINALGSKLANIMVEFLMSAFSSPPEQTKKRTAVRDEPLCALYLIFDKIKRQSNAFDVTLPSLKLYLGIAIRAMHIIPKTKPHFIYKRA